MGIGLDLGTLRRAVDRHKTVTRVVIADHAGSAPRETGTAMLVWADGQEGTIGGGALEFEALRVARGEFGATLVQKMPLGPRLGQCCGGSVTLVFERFSAADLPKDVDVFTRRITGTAEMPLALTRLHKEQRNQGVRPKLVFNDGWLAESVQPTRQALWLYGAGHVGRAIVEALEGLAFDITWVDTHADRFPKTMPDAATPLLALDPTKVVRHAPRSAHHLVLTYSHAMDLALCDAILRHPHQTLGLIGSKTKRARFGKRLRELGHAQAAIDKIICPIGQKHLGKEPKAIALGIAVELLQTKRQTAANPVMERAVS